jgi:electron transfer flavoprotein beta subunit
MKAKKKPLDILELASLGVDATPLVKVVKFEAPPQRQKGVIVKDAAELVAALKQKGLV